MFERSRPSILHYKFELYFNVIKIITQVRGKISTQALDWLFLRFLPFRPDRVSLSSIWICLAWPWAQARDTRMFHPDTFQTDFVREYFTSPDSAESRNQFRCLSEILKKNPSRDLKSFVQVPPSFLEFNVFSRLHSVLNQDQLSSGWANINTS